MPHLLGPDGAPLPPSSVLADPRADAALGRQGYVVTDGPLIDADLAAHLRERFGAIHGWEDVGWHNAFNRDGLGARHQAHDELVASLAEPLGRCFVDFEPFFATYLVKWRGQDRNENFLFLHQDWTYIDERAGARSYVVFLALEEIGEGNGMVHVLPAGNHLDEGCRGTKLIAPWLRHDEVLRSHMVALPLQAGQAAIWDGAIVHGSEQNRSDRPRVAAGIWMRPKGLPLVHHVRTDDGRAARYEMTAEFFRQQSTADLEAHLRHLEPVEVVDDGFVDYDEDELRALLDRNEQALAG